MMKILFLLVAVVHYIEELSRSYNVRLFRKVLDISCYKIGTFIPLLEYNFVERHIFHIRESDSGGRWLEYHIFQQLKVSIQSSHWRSRIFCERGLLDILL